MSRSAAYLLRAKNPSDSLRTIAKAMPGALGGAFYREAGRVQRFALPLTPVEFDRLRGSQYVTPPTGPALTVEFGYGAAHAVPVHENTDPTVQWGEPGTGPKYFQKAIDATDAGRLQRIADDAWANVRDGREFGRADHEFVTRPRGGPG